MHGASRNTTHLAVSEIVSSGVVQLKTLLAISVSRISFLLILRKVTDMPSVMGLILPPPHSCVEIQTPSTLDCDLIWK